MKSRVFVFDITHYECREILAKDQDEATEILAKELKSEGYDINKTTDFECVESYTPEKGE